MGDFLKNIGIAAIFFALLYGYKKLLEYHEDKQSDLYKDEKVYKAAAAFAHGMPYEEVKIILAGCSDFDEENAGKVLTRVFPRRTDKDGGYRAFIRCVNKALGENIYNEKYRMP